MQDVGFDLETNKQGRISIYGFSWNSGKDACAFSRDDNTDRAVKEFFERFKGTLITHNGLTFDLPKLREEGILTNSRFESGQVLDTMLGLHATHAHLAGQGSYDLRSLVFLFGQNGTDTKAWFPLDWKRYDEDIWETCALDAAAALYTSIPLRKEIQKQGLETTVTTSHQVAPIFYEMGQQGVKLDVGVLERIHYHREEELQQLLQQLPAVTKRKVYKRQPDKVWDEPLNPRSDAVIDYFRQEWNVTLKGRSREDFERVVRDRRAPETARQCATTCAAISKLGSDTAWLGDADDEEEALTFKKVNSEGFIFPQYNITGSPDRPTCSGVNIQNFPRPSEDPRQTPLRASVIPPNNDFVLLAPDFSKIESITTAIEADDWERVNYVLGRDYHQQTADFINSTFGLRLTRQQGKECNHAFDKGESASNLAVRLFGNRTKQHVQDANNILETMLQPFSKTKDFRLHLWNECRDNNPYIAVNKFGRRLLCYGHDRYKVGEDDDKPWLSPDKQREAKIRERWKEALAFLGRSTAIDIVLRKLAASYYDKWLDEYSLPYLFNHDEICWAIPLDKAEYYATIVKEQLKAPVEELGLGFPVDIGIGNNWAEAK